MPRLLNTDLLHNELSFSTSRSGGPGGQNVNKVESKVTLKLDIVRSVLLSAYEKEIIRHALASYITKDGVLLLTAQESRSQLENKEAALRKLDALFVRALRKKKARKPTKPSRAAKLKRLHSKKNQGEKKKWRQKP